MALDDDQLAQLGDMLSTIDGTGGETNDDSTPPKKETVDQGAGAASSDEGEGGEGDGGENEGGEGGGDSGDGGDDSEHSGLDLEDPGVDPGETARLAEIEELKAQIADLKKRMPQEQEPVVPVVEDFNFASDLDQQDLRDLLDDPKEFNNFLNKVYKQAITAAREQALVSIPNVVRHNVLTHMTLREAANDFYARNEDLVAHKPTVGRVFQEMIAKHPELEIPQMFEKVEEETRKRLKLVKKAQDTTTTTTQGKTNPRFPNAPGTRKGQTKAPELTDLQKELDAMAKYA